MTSQRPISAHFLKVSVLSIWRISPPLHMSSGDWIETVPGSARSAEQGRLQWVAEPPTRSCKTSGRPSWDPEQGGRDGW